MMRQSPIKMGFMVSVQQNGINRANRENAVRNI